MNLKSALSVLLTFQLIFAPVAYSAEENDYDDDGPSYDFSEEPFVITNGEDDREGYDDGNCTGAGCGDDTSDYGKDNRDDDWNARDEGYDRDDNGSSGYEHNDESIDNGHGDYIYESHDRPRKIIISDKDRGDGLVFVRDDRSQIYYRGEPSQLINDEQGDYYTTDHTDAYINEKSGKYFVKSSDGKNLLSINNLLDCAPSFTCEILGFRKDWWNYSIGPDLNNADELDVWYHLEEFSKTQLQIKNLIERSKTNLSIRQNPEKISILNEAEYLHSEAQTAYSDGQYNEASTLQEGATQLMSTIVDIGISISPLGWAKDAYELIIGKNIVDGHALTNHERLLAGIGTIAPLSGPLGYAGLKLVTRGAKASKNTELFVKVAKLSEKVVIDTPQGKAVQEMSRVALELKASITSETKLFRTGTRGKNMTGMEAQFWAVEHPNSPGYISGHGIPEENVKNIDFIETARIKENVPFVTRTAPKSGNSPGGKIEVVVPKGGVIIDGHYSL